jgi:hypothetical protein
LFLVCNVHEEEMAAMVGYGSALIDGLAGGRVARACTSAGHIEWRVL